MKRWLFALPCALVLAASVSAQGGTRYGPTGGDNLLSVAGSISTLNFDGFSLVTLTGQFGFGRFLTDVHEVGATLSTSYSNPEKGNSSTSEGLFGYYNYNWRENPRTWFYGGPHLGISIFDAGGDDDTSLSLGGHAGMRHWLTPRTAFYAEPRLTFGSDIVITEIIFGYTIAL
jgi:hypothetical protein